MGFGDSMYCLSSIWICLDKKALLWGCSWRTDLCFFSEKKIVRNTLSFPQWNQRPLHIYVGMDKKPSLPVGSSIIYAHWKNSFVYREMPGDVHPKCYWWSSLGFRAFRGFCAFSTAHGLLLEFLLCSLLNMGHIKLPFCFIFNTKRNFYEMSEQRSSKDHIISVAF